jgi:two-component system sensor histidine kinase UhpB
MNRELLKKLRPVTLGRVSLSDLLDELVAGVERRHPEVRLSQSFAGIARSYGEAVDLTLFRCVQEGLTNAVRHGGAGHISIEIADESEGETAAGAARRRLRLHLADDGKGIAPATPLGFGLAAMRERVRSVGGSCVVANRPPRGTAVNVLIPIGAALDAGPRRAHTVESLA